MNPNNATAHHWYAEYLTWLERFDEALRESERARQLDPLSLTIAVDNGQVFYYSRQYDLALAKFRAVREVDGNFHPGLMAGPYEQKGMLADALTELLTWPVSRSDSPYYWSMRAYLYGRTGEPAQARRALAKLEEMNRHRPIDPAIVSWAYLGMGASDVGRAREKLTGIAVRPIEREARTVLETIRLRDEARRREILDRPGRSPCDRPAVDPIYFQTCQYYQARQKEVSDPTTLIVVDEADRLQMNSLEQVRSVFDSGDMGMILIGMLGIEKRAGHHPAWPYLTTASPPKS